MLRFFLGCALLFMVFLSSCGQRTAKQSVEVKATRTIAVILPTTMAGIENPVTPIQRGFLKALTAHPLREKIKLEWSFEDDKNLPEEGIFQLQKLTTQKPVDMIFSFSSPAVVKALRDMGSLKKTSVIYPLNGYPQELATPGQIFLGSTLEFEAQKMAQRLKIHPENCLLIYTSQSYGGRLYADRFSAELDGKLLSREFLLGEQTLIQALGAINLDNATNIIFFSDPDEFKLSQNQLQELGLENQIIAPGLSFTGGTDSSSLDASLEDGGYRALEYFLGVEETRGK